jgi:predicted AAA+ superfamily ATPase
MYFLRKKFMFSRAYGLSSLILEESFFLFGPRQTGKTTQLLMEFPDALLVDLLRPGLARELQQRPEYLSEMILQYLIRVKHRPLVIIDEIQKIPILLDVIQSEIFKAESKEIPLRFILTGSSPRKIFKQGQNLLGGRLGLRTFWPLSYVESKSDPNIIPSLLDLVQWGGLPAVIKSGQKKSALKRYVDVYLDQEVRMEGLSRNLTKFSRFLEIAALSTGQQISMRGIASDVGLSESTVAAWFGILEDTLVGLLLPCFQKTMKRKAMTSRKFYFFDCGLANALLGRFSLSEATPEFGTAMENYIYQNLRVYLAQSLDNQMGLFYWRSVDHEEVDFIVTKDGVPVWAIEVKSGERLKETDFSGLIAFSEDFPQVRKTLVCRINLARRRTDGIEVLPVENFLEEIGSH